MATRRYVTRQEIVCDMFAFMRADEIAEYLPLLNHRVAHYYLRTLTLGRYTVLLRIASLFGKSYKEIYKYDYDTSLYSNLTAPLFGLKELVNLFNSL